jgi:hypothetical protein
MISVSNIVFFYQNIPKLVILTRFRILDIIGTIIFMSISWIPAGVYPDEDQGGNDK